MIQAPMVWVTLMVVVVAAVVCWNPVMAKQETRFPTRSSGKQSSLEV